jgi:hypothetical protein
MNEVLNKRKRALRDCQRGEISLKQFVAILNETDGLLTDSERAVEERRGTLELDRITHATKHAGANAGAVAENVLRAIDGE